MSDTSSHDITIHYEVAGQGAPVVLLHSFLCSGAMWAEQLEPLAARHRVINIDARGHGRSGPVPGPFTLDDALDDVTAVLDAEAIERAVWVGLSLGGFVALRAALRRPERVAGLALLDTDGGAEHYGMIRCKYRALAMIARTAGLGPVIPKICRQMFGTTTLRERPDLVREWADRFRALHVPSTVRTLDAFLRRRDVRPQLRRLALPAIVLVGSEDASLPPARSRALAAALPGARLHEIAGAGHLTALEQPAAVNRFLLRFLDAAY